jgi:undecaprenyl-diphosphatase
MIAALPGALRNTADPFARMVRYIVVGTIPVVIVGVLFNDYVEEVLRTPRVAASALALGAGAMFAAERTGARTRAEDRLTWTDALLIGCAQALALIPGVSRSGSTIAVGLFLGLRRDAAARFTFLLAIPAMLAAAGKESLELRHMALTPALIQLFVAGMLVSGGVGYVTIKYFLRFLAGHRLDVFAYYRVALAALTFVWLIAG